MSTESPDIASALRGSTLSLVACACHLESAIIQRLAGRKILRASSLVLNLEAERWNISDQWTWRSSAMELTLIYTLRSACEARASD